MEVGWDAVAGATRAHFDSPCSFFGSHRGIICSAMQYYCTLFKTVFLFGDRIGERYLAQIAVTQSAAADRILVGLYGIRSKHKIILEQFVVLARFPSPFIIKVSAFDTFGALGRRRVWATMHNHTHHRFQHTLRP